MAVFTRSIKLLLDDCFSSISSQKVLILPVEKHWVWKPIYSFRDASWAPIGLEFPWELRTFTKLAILYLGQETGKATSGYLTDQPPLAKEKLALLFCSMPQTPRVGSERGHRPWVWPDLQASPLLRPQSVWSLWHTYPLGLLSSNWFFKFKYRIHGKTSHILKLDNLSSIFYEDINTA